MRPLRPCFIALCLSAGLAGARAPEPSWEIYEIPGGAQAESLLTIARQPLPPLHDLSANRFGELLALGSDGELFTLTGRDSLVKETLSGDLGAGVWPEAISSDGLEWLLLVSQGRAIARLGRRGEALERLQIPSQDGFWRGLESDRSGRIWLAEESGPRFALLSRGAQILQLWDLEERFAGFRGPVRAWCTDGRGGLFVAEGWPLRVHHLNGAGNALASWEPELPEGELALAADGDGRLFALVAEAGAEPRFQTRAGQLVVAVGGELWILSRHEREPR
jgi:hypothetical protein